LIFGLIKKQDFELTIVLMTKSINYY